MVKYELYECKTILNQSDSNDIDSFIGSINPYLGCEHGCKYCYVQSLKYSPYDKIDSFSYTIRIKKNADVLLNNIIGNIRKGIICIGSSSDPYQPAEKKFKITHSILKILNKYEFPVHIFTKSNLILDDIELLKQISNKTFLAVSFSIITLDRDIVKIFEPYAPEPELRLIAMNELSRNKIKTGVAIMPVLPYVTDSYSSFDKLIRAVKENGGKYVWSGELNLRDQQKEKYLGIIRNMFPMYLKKYLMLYGNRISPEKKYIKNIRSVISALINKYQLEFGLNFNGTDFIPYQIEFEFG